jgi:hypothetical protein
MENKREIGNRLEQLVVDKIKIIEKNCRRTKNSGANNELQDILSSLFICQAKVDNTHSNIIIKIKDWKKLFRDIPINSRRVPLFINQQKDGIITITLGIDDYFRTIYKCYKEIGEI